MSFAKFLKATIWLIWKDLKSEWRSRELISAMLVFALITLLVFNFALELETEARSSVITGIIWVTLTFAGTVGLNRSFSREKDQGCLDGLLLAPVDRYAIYLAKLIVNWLVMLIILVIVIPVAAILFNVNLLFPQLIFVIVFGTLGYAEAGTLLAGVTIQTRMRDLLLPVILFPVVIPLILAAVRASSGILSRDITGSVGFWILMIAGFDLIFAAGSYLLFDFVIRE
jgi:heme exporter protein B